MTCEVCGGPLKSNNKIGVCRRTPECERARWEHYNALKSERRAQKRGLCVICGVRLGNKNRFGICNSNPDCDLERRRVKSQIRRDADGGEENRTTRQRWEDGLDRVKLFRAAKAAPCTDCGKSYPSYCMEFDHCPERGAKEFSLTLWDTTGNGQLTLDELKVEMAKCGLVCALCHNHRTYLRGRKLTLTLPPWAQF